MPSFWSSSGGPTPRWREIRERTAHAQTVAPRVGWQWSGADGTRLVVIGHLRTAQSAGGVQERRLERCQLRRCVAANRKWALRSVPVVSKIGIRFDAPEEWQHLCERPAWIAQLGPAVIVARVSSQRNRRIDGRAPADEATPPGVDRPAGRIRFGDEAPVRRIRHLP